MAEAPQLKSMNGNTECLQMASSVLSPVAHISQQSRQQQQPCNVGLPCSHPRFSPSPTAGEDAGEEHDAYWERLQNYGPK